MKCFRMSRLNLFIVIIVVLCCAKRGGGAVKVPGFVHPWNAEICLYTPWRTKVFFQFEIIINVLVSYFRFILIPILWVYGH